MASQPATHSYPVRHALILLLACVLWPIKADEPLRYLTQAVANSSGSVFAYNGEGNNAYYTLDGLQWISHSGLFANQPYPRVVAAAQINDGSIDFVWTWGAQGLAVTNDTGAGQTVVGEYLMASPEHSIFDSFTLEVKTTVDAENRLWITGNFLQVFRADPKDGLKLIYEMNPTDTQPRPRLGGSIRTHAVEDGRGRMWVWVDYPYPQWTNPKGVFLIAGDKPELHPNFGAFSVDKIGTMARADDRHMWAAVEGDGIYLIDIDSFTAQREADPVPKAFDSVTEFFADHGDLYAVAGPSFGREPRAIWRRRDGHWTNLVPSVDHTSIEFSHPRSWCPIAQGLLVSSYGGGPWYIPHDGTPLELTWRSGFPLESVYGLIHLPDDTFFAFANNAQTFHGRLQLPPHDKLSPRVTSFESKYAWDADPQGNVWIIRDASRKDLPFTQESSPNDLSEWNGEKWISHPIPPDILQSTAHPCWVTCDSVGRVWSELVDYQAHIFVYDPRGPGRWYDFPRYEDAYLAFKDEPPVFHAYSSNSHRSDRQGVYFADHRRLALINYYGQVAYYDGSNWHFYTRQQIEPKWTRKDWYYIERLFLDADDHICVNLDDKTSWRLDPAGTWSQFDYHPFPDPPIPTSHALYRPTEGITTLYDAIAEDNHGVFWLTWQNRLYRCVPGITVPVFGPDELNPFVVPSLHLEVTIDPKGNAVFQAREWGDPSYIIRPQNPVAPAQISVEKRSIDSILARVSSSAPGPLTLRWRLDGGAWQWATQQSELTLRYLSNGSHRLEAIALDRDLESSPSAIANFELHYDPAQQLVGFIADLLHGSYAERCDVVDRFSLQPARARSALQEARLTANDDQRWWIDVALQDLDGTAAQPPKSSPREDEH